MYIATIFKKDVASLSKTLQCILFRIHQYRVRIIYKPGSDLYIADWQPRKKPQRNKEPESTVDIPQKYVHTGHSEMRRQ